MFILKFKNLNDFQKQNLIALIISISLFIIAILIMDDISLPIFGLGVIIIGVVLLRIVNNNN